MKYPSPPANTSASATHAPVITAASFALTTCGVLLNTPRSSVSIASTKAMNPIQNQMLVATMWRGILGTGGPETRRAGHYGTGGDRSGLSQGSTTPFSRPGTLARSVLTIGCSSTPFPSAPAGYSPLPLKPHQLTRFRQ